MLTVEELLAALLSMPLKLTLAEFAIGNAAAADTLAVTAIRIPCPPGSTSSAQARTPPPLEVGAVQFTPALVLTLTNCSADGSWSMNFTALAGWACALEINQTTVVCAPVPTDVPEICRSAVVLTETGVETAVLKLTVLWAGLELGMRWPLASSASATARFWRVAVILIVKLTVAVPPTAMVPRLQSRDAKASVQVPWLLMCETSDPAEGLKMSWTIALGTAVAPIFVTTNVNAAFAPTGLVEGPVIVTLRFALPDVFAATGVTPFEAADAPLSPIALMA
jgi:hypothetical protein